MNYYNEIDEYAAQWLRNLIAEGHIAPGHVDTRSIEDVRPDDLRGYAQCHFFAGVGVWSYALRRAGVPDDADVWTGSCPCQPFSAAGQGGGMDDKRHLWPHFQWLISKRKPAIVLGEQVASRDAEPWIDLVHADMEALGYAFGAVPFPAASVGAPHIRDRLYWVAHADYSSEHALLRTGQNDSAQDFWGRSVVRLGGLLAGRDQGESGRMADTYGSSCGKGSENIRGRSDRGYAQSWSGLGGSIVLNRVADPAGSGLERSEPARESFDAQRATIERDGALGGPGPVNGLWSAADWLLCRDAKWRPVEPGTFPLAHGAPARVGRLRAYGNAINAEQATLWCKLTVPLQCRT